MTNFARWLIGMTPEKFLDISNQWCGNLPICKDCGKGDGDCRKAFFEWANFDCLKDRDEKRCVKCTHPCDEAWIVNHLTDEEATK